MKQLSRLSTDAFARQEKRFQSESFALEQTETSAGQVPRVRLGSFLARTRRASHKPPWLDLVTISLISRGASVGAASSAGVLCE